MANLVLLKKDDVQKVWKGYTREHGVYALSFESNNLTEYHDNTCRVSNVAGAGCPGVVDLRLSMKKVFHAMTLDNCTVHNQTIRIIGRFVKIGRSVLFEPLQEQF